jgi:tetratricopeptide (TPR) repeat protein
MNARADRFADAMDRLMEEESFDAAIRVGGEWLAVTRRKHGPDHPENIAPLNRLGFCLQESERSAEAEDAFTEVLRLVEGSAGRECPEYGLHLGNLASLHAEQGRFDLSWRLYVEAGRLLVRYFPPDSEFLLEVARNAALPLLPDDGSSSGVVTAGRAVAFLDALSMPPMPAEILLRTLAGEFVDEKRYDVAELLYRRILEIWVGAVGPGHLYVAECLQRLGLLNLYLNRPADALACAEREFEIRRRFPRADEQGWKDCKALLRRAKRSLARGTDRPAGSLRNTPGAHKDSESLSRLSRVS